MKGQYTFEEAVDQCRKMANQLLIDLDLAEISEDENELNIITEDAGNFFLGVAEECE